MISKLLLNWFLNWWSWWKIWFSKMYNYHRITYLLWTTPSYSTNSAFSIKLLIFWYISKLYCKQQNSEICEIWKLTKTTMVLTNVNRTPYHQFPSQYVSITWNFEDLIKIIKVRNQNFKFDCHFYLRARLYTSTNFQLST